METLDPYLVATGPGVHSTPSPEEVTLAQDLESSETSPVVGKVEDMSPHSYASLRFMGFMALYFCRSGYDRPLRVAGCNVSFEVVILLFIVHVQYTNNDPMSVVSRSPPISKIVWHSRQLQRDTITKLVF